MNQIPVQKSDQETWCCKELWR